MLGVPGATAQNTRPLSPILFDDFSYTNKQQLKKNGWIVRTVPGWPGVPGAKWLDTNVTLLKDPKNAKNRILRMTSSTDGTPENTTQTQICHQRKYLEGTYAARVRFSDAPISGPERRSARAKLLHHQPVESSDGSRLQRAGLGIPAERRLGNRWTNTLFNHVGNFQPEPNWKKDNVFKTTNGNQGGWHTLVTQVTGGKVTYFVDGKLHVEHGGEYYPEDTMSINFNLWFIRDGMIECERDAQIRGRHRLGFLSGGRGA